MSNFSEFIQQNEITAAALVATSKGLENFTSSDRELMSKRHVARGAKDKKSYEELNLAKAAHSGRGVSINTVNRAIAGTKLSRLARGKLLRAVNALLVQQKKDAVDVLALFGNNAQPKDESAEESAE